MSINIIAAIGPNNIIGNKGKLPWHIPDDLKRFKKLTLDHPVIMGRKTYESIGRPLPNRENIVITSQKNYSAPGCSTFSSLKEALNKYAESDIFIIGGAKIYKQAMPFADHLYITEIKIPAEGDVYFPEYDKNEWREMEREKHEQFNFVTYKKL